MRYLVAFVCFALLFSGCGGQGSGTRHKLTTDSDAVFNAFIAAAREYYATRDDGVLSEPQMKDNRATLLYRYKLVKGGNHTEQVSLSTHRPKPQDPDPVRMAGPTWIIGAWHLKDGSDPEIRAVAQEIERRTLEKLTLGKQ